MVTGWFFTILIICLAIQLYIGFHNYKGAQTLEDYYVASHQASPLLVAGSWAATWVSGGAMVGIVAIVYTVGYSALMTWFFAIWVLPITFWLVASKARHYSEKWSAMTMCEMVGKRYDSTALRAIFACSIVLFIFFAMVAQLKIGGIIFEVVSPIPYSYAVVISTAVIAVYVGLGGMRSVLWTETFLCILMCIAIVIFFLVGLAKVGWIPGLEKSLLSDPVGFKFATAAGFSKESNMLVNMLTSPNHFDVRPALGEFSLLGMLGWGLALAVGSSALPHQASRFLAVKRLEKPVFKKLVLWCTLFIMVLSLSIFFGLFGRAIFGGNLLKNADYVTPTLALEILPAPIAAFVLTAVMFAIITTVATMLYLISTTIARDLIQGVVWKKATDKDTLLITRWTSVIFAILAMIFAITNPPEMMMLFHYLVNPGLGFTFFFILIIGFYWKGATKAGAIVSCLGVLFATMYLRFVLNWPQGPLCFWTFLLCAVLFFGVSFVTRAPQTKLVDDLFSSNNKEGNEQCMVGPGQS